VVDPRPGRIAALLAALDRANLDALLLTGLANIRYLTGFSGSSAIALVMPRQVVLISDSRYAVQAEEEAGAAAVVDIQPRSLWAGLWHHLGALPGVHTVGFEASHITHRDFQRLMESGARWQWRPTTDMVEELRERKDAGEVEAIRRAGEVATRALDRLLRGLRPGLTEFEVAGLLEHALRDEGSEGFPFPTIVASGPRSALPHAMASGRVVEEGELLLLDFGAELEGYCSDITRTVVLGRADSRQREVHEVVREAQARGVQGVSAGMTGEDADALARDYIQRRGFGEYFQHSLGHGIGLEVHEAPRLARRVETPLPQGAVVTIEPGIYLPGWGGVRIEDDVHLGSAGPELLTHFPRELIEVA